MSQSPNRSTFSRRVVQAVSALRSMLFRRLFRSSIYESIRPSASGRSSWLETISSLVGRGSEEIHRGGALRVSAKERAKRTAAREFRRRFVMAEQLELRALMAADLGLDPTFSQQPVSAEIGALVPGKAADAYFNVDRSDVSGVAQANLEAGVSQAAARLSSFAEGGSFAPTMQEVFGRTGIGRDAFNSAVAGLRSQWATGKLGVRVEVLSASAMNGGLGAFAADYQGAPAIFVNGDWLASNPGADAVAKVLIEEFGHSLDRRINAGIDSPGDEGELFADRVVGLTLNKDDYNRIAKENDRGFVAVSGQSVPIEFAINNGASTYTENTVLTLYTGTNSSDCNNVTGQTVIFTASNVVADDVMTFSGSWDGATPSVGTISLTQNSASSTTATGIANLTYGVAYNSTTRTATVTFTFGASFVTTGQAAAKASRDIINTARYSSGEAPGRTGALVFSLSGTAIAATLPAANSITITPRNDAPVLDTNLSPVLNPILGNLQAPSGTGPITSGTATPISALLGGYSDVDDPAGTGLRGIAITAINTTAGTLWYTLDGGQAWTTVAPISATSHLLLAENNTYLYWQPGTNTSQTVTSVLTFRGWDQSSLSTQSPGTKIDTSGASTPTPAAPDNTRAFSINTETVNVTVTQATNSAPQLADTVLSLTSINEDNPIPSGSNTTSTPVANLVGGITDANSLDGKGIAITAVNTTNGTLYYTLDNGTNWALVGSVSNTSALLLPSNGNNARLHFVPTVNFNGTADGVLTFRAWDQTSGSAGSKVSTATNGGTSAFSSATDTVSLIVNAVNDAPVATGAALLAAINEDDANPSGASVQSLFSGNFDDSFDAVTGGSSANSFAGIAIALYTVNAAQGQWQYSANGTSGWTNLAGVTARSSATVIPSGHFLRFLPAANFAGSAPTITAHLIDDSSGAVTFQTGLNITTVGSTTQYSNLTVVLSHTVTAVNDPPVRTAPATLPTISVNEDSANTTAVSLGLSALAYSNGGGTDENGQTLTYTITSIPAFVRIFKADGVSEVTASSTVSLTELQGLMYRTVANASGAGTLQWTVVDSGANTNGNSNTLTESLSMTVTAVNDAPVVYLGGGTTLNVFRQFTEGGTAVSIAPSAVISDVDSAQLQSLTITLTNAQNTGEEALNVTGNTADFTVVGNGTTTVTISGNQSLAAYATLLQSVTYSNTSANPTVNPVRTITVVARDNEAASSANSAASTASIALAAVNNPPTYNTGLPNQTATNLLPFSYQYPTNAFTDPEGDALTITAQQVVGSTASPLPSWITFNPTLRRFYGVAPAGVTSLVVRVTATDPSGGSVSQDFTITVSTLLGGNPIAAVGFATAYNLINPQDHSTSNYYQVETNSFTTASAPMAGTNFVFYQQNGVVLENGIYKFSGNNVPGKLTYINTIGEVVEVPSNNSLGIVSRPIKTPTNAVQGYYMYLDNGTPEGSTLPGGAAGNTDDTAVLLVVNPSYFSGLKQYNSSSDQVDSNLNGYLTSVGFSVSNASGNEGNGTAGTANSTPIRFVVTRDSTTATATASVQFTTSIVSGLNTASTNDFVARSGTANFAAGQLTTTIDISPVNDAVFENNETFTLTLSNPTVTDGQTVQGRLNNSTATGTILNDDSTSFSIAPSGAEEGTPPGTGNPITFTVTRNGASALSQSVSYATALKGTGEGFASADDFTSVSGTLTFAPGETTKTFTVNTVADATVEIDEVFAVNLSGATNGATISTASVDGTIEDDESTSIYSVAASSAIEGSAITFTITRSRDVDVPQNISFYTMLGADDTAASGDFVGVANNTTPLSAQTVTFAPGDLTKTFSVATNQDALYELNETFTVVLYALQNVGRQSKISAFNGSAKGTILDNDTLPVFSVSVLSADAGGVVESVTGTTRSIRFVVTRTALSEAAQTIDYATVLRAGDNASELDYVPATGTLTFPSSGTNSLTQTVSVELRNDNIAEPTETFGFRISNPSLSASSLGSPSEATGTILDSNQLPTTGESSVTPLEDTRYIFKVADFNYADNEGMPLTNVRVVSLPSATAGVLRLATSYDAQGRPATWTDVTAGQEISVSGTFGIEGGGLFFDPVANKNNLNLSVISFTHQVRDDKDFSIQSGTVTINITPVNDAPASANDTVIAHQREVYVFKDQADFNFSDPNDVPVNNRLEVIITGLPLKGKLLYKSGASWPSNGITLNNQGEYIVSFQDIMDGKFGYLAGDNDPVSSPSTTFPFKVRDDGGTTDGGVNTSGQHTMTINLQDYRGPRQSVPIEQTIDEDTSLVFSTANGNAITVSFEGDETNVDKTLETTLSVDPSISGVLALGSEPQNLTIVKNGNSYTLTGTATLINQALDGLSFTPPVNANSVTQSGGHTYAILTISTINKPPAGQTQWTQDTDTVDIGVRPVNDAPVASGSASLTAVTEDATDPAGATVATLFASNFSDATDQVTGGSSANTLAGIAITGYSRDANKGEWQYRNNAASGGWTTIGASINGDSSSRTYKSSDSLRFLPAGNFNGPAPTLTVRLIESSTPSAVVTDAVVNVSNNGGITSISAATVVLSTSVNADNDAPTILPGSAPSLAVISEDNFDPAGATVTSLLSGSFSDADDNQLALGGTDERNNFAGIAIVGYTRAATKGEWWYKDNANSGAWTQIASSITGDATSLTLKATDSLRFVPVANFNGQAPALSVRLIETPRSITTGATVDVSGSNNGGTTTVSAATVTLTHTVNAVNDAPVVVNSSATLPAILEGNVNPSGATVAFLFNLSFNDQKDNVVSGSQANTLAGVAINKYNYNAATDIGVWQYSVDGGANWLDLSAISSDSNAFILKRTDMMRFLPKDTDVNGTPPVLEARLIDSSWVNLTTGSGNVSTNGDPTAISSSVVTLTTSVTSVNDAPEGPTGKSITPNEDTTYTFTPANFGYQDGFTDPKDSPANNFIKVVITTLPTAGTIQLNGQNISAGTAISLRDLQEGNLKYIPVANASGSPYATLTFQVRDDGGTANGGVDTDSTPRTMTINVLSVNDAPTSQNKTVWTDEDVAYAFGGSDFAFFDANDTPANALASVTITSLPTVGTLALSGSNVTVGQVIDADQLANLSFTPVPDANGNNYATVGFRVTDNGGTDRGGVNTSVSAYTITINVDPVNDAPAPTGNATLASVFKTNTDPAGATVSSLFGSVFSDPLDSGTQKDNFAGIAITTHTIDSAKGDWEYQASGAGSWLPISNATLSSAFTLKDTDKIRFKPNSSYTGAATPLAARLIETPTNPTTAAVLNLTGLVGGTTTYSALEAQLNHQVQGGLLVKGPSDVSEGTRAVFSVSLDSSSSETVVTLSLDNIGLSAESDDYESVFNANAASPDASLVLVYYLDGSNQPVYLAASGGVVTIPSGITKIYVSVPTTQNSIYEGAESFRLTASIDGSNASDTSTILDNGRGVEYNQDGTPKGSLTYTPDNDLTVDVTAINTVNEGSDYSFFTVLGSSGDSLRLSLGNPTSGTAASLVSPRIDYAVLRPDGTTQAADWTQYNGTTNLPLVPGALGSGTGVVFVRVSIVSEQDTVYEGAESFTLTATSVENSAKNDVDTSTIVDDGSGKKFGPELSGGAPSESTTNLDDDRALTVTAYGPVNELRTAVGTMYSMFKVTAPAGSTLNLSLGNDVTNPALIAGFTMEYLNQGTWVPYSSSNRPSVPNVGQTGDVYVRVNVHSEWDALATNSSFFEGTERFRLIATTQTNRSSSGIGEIIDDGTGNVYTGAWPSGSSTPTTLSAQLDDDRVWATDNSLFTNIQAVVTVDARANDGAVSGVTISDQIDLNPATSAVDSDLIVNGQGTWSVVSGNITYTRLASYTLDPTPITYAIRPTDRPGNFSRNTATVTIDFPVIAQPDSNALVDSSGNPVSPGTEVLIEVLANDLAGDAPVGSTLRFASNDSTTLNVSGQGVWTIVLVSGKYYVKFTPEIGFVGDPTPVNYVVNDEQGNVSAPTKVSVVYNRGGAFVVRVDDKSASGFDVVIVDNQPAGRTIDLGGVSVTTTVADTNSTLGRIAWTGLTSNFSRIQVDAKSKPVLTAAMADITLIVNATSSAAGTVEVQAMDMGYNLVSGNWTLASPLGGINYGSVTFSETLGLSNEPFPTSSSVRNASPAQTARTLNWSRSSSFTLGASTSVSLMKSVTIAHTRGSLTTQAQAGGKLVETSAPVDMRPYLDWVLPVGAAFDTSAPASTVTAVERKSSGFETAAPAEIFKKIGSVAIASTFGIVDTDALSDRSLGEQTSEVSEFGKMTPDARLKNRLNLRGRIK